MNNKERKKCRVLGLIFLLSMVYVSLTELLGWGSVAQLPLYFSMDNNGATLFILILTVLGSACYGILFYTDKKPRVSHH
ncbi:MAG: hypothetical protein M0T81_00045 [Thermoplasmatales archaeon]|jgi:hypothetical protein|nr:hypothetical protein [Thermoplasmatales archaeon]